jgi:hypothetical protein
MLLVPVVHRPPAFLYELFEANGFDEVNHRCGKDEFLIHLQIRHSEHL